jgi:exonuclease III
VLFAVLAVHFLFTTGDTEGVGKLTFNSFNVRGIKDRRKRDKIFHHLKTNYSGIHCIQESHITELLQNEIRDTWGPNCYFSNGSNFARGVITIIPKEITFIEEEVIYDTDGRFIVIKGIFNSRKLCLVNWYAPTQDKPNEQNSVFNDIMSKITNSCHELVWCGDFNMYLSGNLDKYKSTDVKDTPMVTKLKSIMEENELVDIWRILNPDLQRYTWRKITTKGLSQSRLDYFIVPMSFVYNVASCSINPAFYSYHNIISMTIHAPMPQQRGKGTWKFNNSLLRDCEYTAKMKVLFEECKTKYRDINDKRLVWDVIKSDIRGFTISHSSHKAKKVKEYETKLLQEGKELEELICVSPTDDAIQRLLTNKSELMQIAHERNMGAQVRANCLHIEENEYTTKYFLSKEKSRAQAKAMTTLIDDDGETTNDLKEIANQQQSFYQNLYQEKDKYTVRQVQEANKQFLDDIDIKQISDDDKDVLDLEITPEEIALTLKDLSNNKTPGSDGLGTNFYNFFWTNISSFVCDSILYGIKHGELSIDQKRAILNLLPKKDKDCRYLKNWRPLSLLNTDYKIIAKLLSNRLQKVLPEIISLDQSGCIKNRSAINNIRSTIDIINFAKEKNIPGIIAFIDFEKAFDMVKWSFLYKSLEKLNVGEYYIKCIKTLYTDISTYVSNCGTLSQPFKPTRGIRQGCPISANLFIIIVEMLANVIRQNKNIKGIKIGKREFKITQFADDTCIYVADSDSLGVVFHILTAFSKCAGLQANKDKSEALGIGSTSNFRHKTLGIKWPMGSIKSLGIYINNNTDKMIKENFNERLDKIAALAQQWCLRKLTLKGKIVIVNTLLMPQLLYACSVLHTPDWVVKQFKQMVTTFIWDGKPSKVKYACMVNTIEQGGLKLQDISCKVQSLKIKWLQNMCKQEEIYPWKSYIETITGMEAHKLLQYNMSYKDFPGINESFYTDMFKMWTKIHNVEPTTGEQVAREVICHNSYIRINNKCISRKDWNFPEIKTMQDLLDNQHKISNREYLKEKYDIKIPQLLLNSIITAVPKMWKKLLVDDTNAKNYVVFDDYIVRLEKEYKLCEITTKNLYWFLLSKTSSRPTSEASWQDEVGLNFDDEDWRGVYTNIYTLIRDTRLLTFHFKITHRFLACKFFLCTWKIKLDNICDLCNKEIDCIEHHLIACENILPFWNSIFIWWNSAMEMSFPVDTYDILFGIINPNKDKNIIHLNYVFIHALYHVYRCRQQQKPCSLYEFLITCKNSLDVKRINMLEKGKDKDYENIWAPLYEVF